VLNSLELRDKRVARAVYALPWETFQTPWSPLSRGPLSALVRMLEALNLNGSERVLDIGTGTGHRAALLGSLASHVCSLEISEAVATSARGRLRRAGCENIEVLTGDGGLGWAPGAPYDAILVGCACPRVPNLLIHQLAEGGRLVLPVGDATGQLIVRVCRRALAVESTTVAPCMLGLLEGHEKEPSSVPWQRLPSLGSHPLTPTLAAGARSSR
jgi:protein-L-isoaspartate(D-aspartate) O-methyltransferase